MIQKKKNFFKGLNSFKTGALLNDFFLRVRFIFIRTKLFETI